MLTYKSWVSYNVFVSKNKKVGAWAATYAIFFTFLFRCFINLFTNEAVLNIIAQTSGITKLIFARWQTSNPRSSPIPEHENNRFWLFRDNLVILEAVLNIIVQATAFARVFFFIKVWKWKRNWLPQNRVFLTTLIYVFFFNSPYRFRYRFSVREKVD